jgi:hypothetical protein
MKRSSCTSAIVKANDHQQAEVDVAVTATCALEPQAKNAVKIAWNNLAQILR